MKILQFPVVCDRKIPTDNFLNELLQNCKGQTQMCRSQNDVIRLLKKKIPVFSDISKTANKYMLDKFYLLVLLKLPDFNAMPFTNVGNIDLTLLHKHMLGLTLKTK